MKETHAATVNCPNCTFDTSFWVTAINRRVMHWSSESVQPPYRNSDNCNLCTTNTFHEIGFVDVRVVNNIYIRNAGCGVCQKNSQGFKYPVLPTSVWVLPVSHAKYQSTSNMDKSKYHSNFIQQELCCTLAKVFWQNSISLLLGSCHRWSLCSMCHPCGAFWHQEYTIPTGSASGRGWFKDIQCLRLKTQHCCIRTWVLCFLSCGPCKYRHLEGNCSVQIWHHPPVDCPWQGKPWYNNCAIMKGSLK